MKLSWDSKESILLVNPSYSAEERNQFQRILHESQRWPGHFWLATSGSRSSKWAGLAKEAILASADAVNRHLESSRHDCWINPLPSFHVGGLGIWARAHLSGAAVHDFKPPPCKWQAQAFHAFVEERRGSLTSLVPAQLYDLVALSHPAPPSLRAVVVGGGALPPLLYERAVHLGWPLLPSYGATECGSQVATAALEECRQRQLPSLRLLPHIKAVERGGALCFSGPSLLSTYAYVEGVDRPVRFADPKVEGWWASGDRGCLHGGTVEPLGRVDAVVKVGGENVDLAVLEGTLEMLRLQMGFPASAVLIALPDLRLGCKLHLVSESRSEEEVAPLIERFRRSVLPFERIRALFLVEAIPRSPLGKTLLPELTEQLASHAPIELY